MEESAQVQNCLRASGLQLGLLVDFGHHPKVGIERLVNARGRYGKVSNRQIRSIRGSRTAGDFFRVFRGSALPPSRFSLGAKRIVTAKSAEYAEEELAGVSFACLAYCAVQPLREERIVTAEHAEYAEGGRGKSLSRVPRIPRFRPAFFAVQPGCERISCASQARA